jgi:hypothetical protein
LDLEIKAADVLYNPGNVEETKARRKQYNAAKLKIHDEYLPQLIKKFGASLRLTDFLGKRKPAGPQRAAVY